MYGHGKSDSPVVPAKSPNKADEAAEAMEGSGLARGNPLQQSTLRTLGRVKRSHLLRHFQDERRRFGVTHPLGDFLGGTL